jgi:hypothetical protein
VTQDLVLFFQPSPVNLEVPEQKKTLLKMFDFQLSVNRVERMRQRMEDVVLIEVPHQVKDVASNRCNVSVLLLVNVIHHDMKLTLVIGKIRGDFFAYEKVLPVRQFQAAVNAVVVSDGDQVHTALFGYAVQIHRLRKTFRTI